jgi:class 3 adenylate cyclase
VGDLDWPVTHQSNGNAMATDQSSPTDAETVDAVPSPGSTGTPTAEERARERTRIAGLLKTHAPPDWDQRFRREELLDAVIDGEPIQMFVMAGDIRNSTVLMKEAVRFERFAFTMDKFVTAVRRGIRGPGGWFDKFTGDGFLAYWIVQSGSDDEYHEHFVQAAGNLVHSAHTLVDFFHRLVLEDFRSNSRNLPEGVGLSMGLDAGPGYLVQIADELTVVGPPVVGAVRMVTAAERPREIIANVFLGERLREEQQGVYEELGVTVTREYRPTKEYPKGQEVYALSFDQDGSALERATDPPDDGDRSESQPDRTDQASEGEST